MTDTPAAPPPAPPPAASQPSTPAEGATQLTALKADPAWTEGLMRGDPAKIKTFHELHELVAKGDGIDQAMSGVTTGIIQDSSQVEMAGTAAMLREIGVRDELIKEFLVGHTTTKAWFDETARLKADLMSDPVWVKRLMSGDQAARRQKTLCDIVLTGGIKEASA
jgi:hypothetical protein